MGKINIQLYSFSDGQHEDIRENLRTAAALGYDGVELFGPCFQISAEEMSALTKELGLQVVSMHVPDKTHILPLIPYAKAVGCSRIGLSIETMLTDADVHRWAREMNDFGKALKEEGCLMIYHNHTQEFAACEGERIIDVLMRETDPESVAFELDAGWCAAAGYDPVEFLKTYSGRVKLVHVKESAEVIGVMPQIDFAKIEFVNGSPVFDEETQKRLDHARSINCPACEGLVDWAKLKETADAAGVEAYIVEREYSKGDRIEELRNDIRRYREIF